VEFGIHGISGCTLYVCPTNRETTTSIDPLDKKEHLLLIEGHINHIGSNDAVQPINRAS
jgi:hypothetical protein